MPVDKAGKFHNTHARAMKANSAPPMHGGVAAEDPHHKVFDHGDGTYHTESPEGEQVEHQSVQDLMSHMHQALGSGHQMQEAEGGDWSGNKGPEARKAAHGGKSLHGM